MLESPPEILNVRAIVWSHETLVGRRRTARMAAGAGSFRVGPRERDDAHLLALLYVGALTSSEAEMWRQRAPSESPERAKLLLRTRTERGSVWRLSRRMEGNSPAGNNGDARWQAGEAEACGSPSRPARRAGARHTARMDHQAGRDKERETDGSGAAKRRMGDGVFWS